MWCRIQCWWVTHSLSLALVAPTEPQSRATLWSHWILSTVEGAATYLDWDQHTFWVWAYFSFPSAGQIEAHPLWRMVPYWVLRLGIFDWQVRYSAGVVASSGLVSRIPWCWIQITFITGVMVTHGQKSIVPWMAHDSMWSKLLCPSFEFL